MRRHHGANGDRQRCERLSNSNSSSSDSELSQYRTTARYCSGFCQAVSTSSPRALTPECPAPSVQCPDERTRPHHVHDGILQCISVLDTLMNCQSRIETRRSSPRELLTVVKCGGSHDAFRAIRVPGCIDMRGTLHVQSLTMRLRQC
jgi:hypothetical protein